MPLAVGEAVFEVVVVVLELVTSVTMQARECTLYQRYVPLGGQNAGKLHFDHKYVCHHGLRELQLRPRRVPSSG
jgi:hypothetical protein